MREAASAFRGAEPATSAEREAAVRALIDRLTIPTPASRLPTLDELAIERPERLPPERVVAIKALSKQLRVVLDLLGEGRDNDDVAYRMRLSKDTVETHCRALRTKLHLRTRSELMAIAGMVAATRPADAERAPAAVPPHGPATDQVAAAAPWAARLQR